MSTSMLREKARRVRWVITCFTGGTGVALSPARTYFLKWGILDTTWNIGEGLFQSCIIYVIIHEYEEGEKATQCWNYF